MSQQTAGVVWPVTDGTRVPFEIYTSQDVFDREQERIFRGPLWNYVALEAEIPAPGDFKTSFVGDTPVVVSRAQDGEVHVFVNRCAHRGATVQRQASGNTKEHRCVYHQWCYDGRGDLISVPYRRATMPIGGYAPDFDMEAHGLRKLHVASRKGVIFATFDPAAPSLEDFLEEPLLDAIDRLFSREVKVLGHMRQRIHGNWKLYVENTRDPYHAASAARVSRDVRHVSQQPEEVSAGTTGRGRTARVASMATTSRSRRRRRRSGDDNYIAGYSLSDPSLMAGRPDFNDNINLAITSIFPSVVVQQIMNTLATRHIRPKAPGRVRVVLDLFRLCGRRRGNHGGAAETGESGGPGRADLDGGRRSGGTDPTRDRARRQGLRVPGVRAGAVPIRHRTHKGEDAVRAFWRYYQGFMA